METIPEKRKEHDLALLRYRVMSYVEDLSKATGNLSEAFRQAHARAWPDLSGRYYSVSTLEKWWSSYRKNGYLGLLPKGRSDKGQVRKIDKDLGQFLIDQVKANPKIAVKVQYIHWLELGKKLPSVSTIYRYLKRHGYSSKELRAGRLAQGPKKMFESRYVNDLWMVDFSPGPTLNVDGNAIKTHLCVIMDDHSRYVLFAGYYPKANTEAFHHCLKEALLRGGLPKKLYTDNGGPFINGHTESVCAELGMRLLHAKPYHSWSKGKVERIILTIQRGYESILKINGNEVNDLDELNARFQRWLQTVYKKRKHSRTGQSPEERFENKIEQLRYFEGTPEALTRKFYMKTKRTVRKDGTVKFDGKYYEVELSLKGLEVQLRYCPFERTEIEVWHQGVQYGNAHPVDLHHNAEFILSSKGSRS